MQHELLSEALDRAMLGICRLDAAAGILDANPAFAALLGLAREEVVGHPLSAFVHQDHQPRLADILETLRRKGVAEAELRMTCRADVTGYVMLWLVNVVKGSEAQTFALMMDTTLQKVSERSYLDTLLLQRAIINCASFAIISTDLEGRVRSFNTTAERWTGYRDLPQGKPLQIIELLATEDFHRHRQAFLQLHGFCPEDNLKLLTFGARHGLDDEGEWHLVGPAEHELPVWLNVKALIDEAGEPTGFLLVATDLREHKAMQLRLQQTEALFRNAFAAAANGIGIFDLQGRLNKANPAFFGILRQPLQEAGFLSEWLDRDSWFLLRGWFSRLIEQDAQPLHEELSIRTTEATVIHVGLSVALMKDDQGLPLYFVLQLNDLTDRNRLDAELRLAASVYSSASEGVYIADAASRIISVNPAFTRITGWAAEEILGQPMDRFWSDYQSGDQQHDIHGSLDKTNFWQGELWCRIKDGRAVLTRLSITRILDAGGQPERFVVLFNDITELRQKDERLVYQAYHDALTDLPNRLMLMERMRQEFLRASRKKQMVALLCLDIDNFKLINESLGHELGDMLIKAVGMRLQVSVRETDLVARLSGDEFAVMLPEVDDLKNVSLVAHKILESMVASFHLQGNDLRISVSIGISVFPQDGGTPAVLLRNADTAMYRAKEQGRNNCQFYTPTLDRQIKERFVLESSLRHALDRNELQLWYQPKLDLLSGRIIGMEALLRWKHPEMGMVSPTQFIPLAEQTGLIVPIGDWVLAQSCRDTRRWQEMGFRHLKVAVNLSARQFRQTDLVHRIEIVLDETGLPPDGLELELTESMIMHNPQESIVALKRLREYGLSLAVDDFGTGYSSLSYLKRFPINTLKIDRSFVSDIPADQDDAAITLTIINLAKNLKLTVVAEGVETREQQDFLRDAGCEYMQGYYFSRPLPAADFESLLLQHR